MDTDTDEEELLLYIDNEFSLYKQKRYMHINLARHVCRGNFQSDRAEKLFSYLTDEAGRKYSREFGSPGWRYPLTARRAANKELVKEFLALLDDCLRRGNCNDLPPEAVALLQKSKCRSPRRK